MMPARLSMSTVSPERTESRRCSAIIAIDSSLLLAKTTARSEPMRSDKVASWPSRGKPQPSTTTMRSEERRVGKECRSRRWPDHEKKERERKRKQRQRQKWRDSDDR